MKRANGSATAFVMAGLVPGIHAFLSGGKTWMAGTSPAMTTFPYSLFATA